MERPRLAEGARVEGGQLRDAHASCLLDPRIIALTPLIDGRPLDALLRAALERNIPPGETLAALRRLHARGLIEGLEITWRRPRRAAEAGLFARWPARIFAAGRALPPKLWSAFCFGGFIALLAALFIAPSATMAPFHHMNTTPRLIFGLLLAPTLALSWRGLWRGLCAESLGLRVHHAGLRLTPWAIPFDPSRRTWVGVEPRARAQIAWVGLSALAWAVAICVALGAWLSSPTAAALAAILGGFALLTLIGDLAPYMRTDAWRLAQIYVEIPDLRRRALRFLFAQVGQNLRRHAPQTRGERRYLRLTSLWLLHGLLSLALLGERVLPSALEVAALHFTAGDVLAMLLSWTFTLAVTAATLALIGALSVFALSLLYHLAAFSPARGEIAPLEEGDAARFEGALGALPFLREGLSALPLAGALERERYAPGAQIIRQGEPGDRLCLLIEGRARVELEEDSGLIHGIAELKVGDLFGEIALLTDQPRTASVRALTPAVVLSMKREAFLELASSERAEEIIRGVRDSSLLRHLPGLATAPAARLAALLEATQTLRLAPGEALIDQGDPSEAIYVLREGACVVSVAREGEAPQIVARLTAGKVVGEMGVFSGSARSATVRAEGAVEALRIPAAAWREALLEDLEALLKLDAQCAARLDALEAS